MVQAAGHAGNLVLHVVAFDVDHVHVGLGGLEFFLLHGQQVF